MIVGQHNIITQIDKLAESGFPRFIVITGQKGQGKTTISHYILHKLNEKIRQESDDTTSCYMIEIGATVNEIRDMIEMAYQQTEPIIYSIQNADKLSQSAKNSLLKIIEEPPQQAYFIMELQQIENTLDTIKSRCYEITLENYTKDDIHRFLENMNVSANSQEIIMNLAENKYQIDLLVKYKPKEFASFIDKVITNIYTVSGANSFKIAEKINLKENDEGYDINLFLSAFRNMSLAKAVVLVNNTEEAEQCEHLLKTCEITTNYLQKLNIVGINKQMLFDNWLIDIRKEWLK